MVSKQSCGVFNGGFSLERDADHQMRSNSRSCIL